jgi:K+-sensing histidine kinase KdpD
LRFAGIRFDFAIEAALEITGYALHSANIELVCELGEGLPPVWGDGDQLGQVLVNLIINAEQAMAETIGARKLTIRTTFDADEDRLEVSVADTGPGIPEDVRSRIFEPFFTTKALGVGTGIGLAERSVDVILSDMRMPDVDGPGLYLRIKNAYPKLLERMVFMTGDTLGPANRAFLERTGLPYLEKPLSPDEVRRVVRQVLAGAGNGSE